MCTSANFYQYELHYHIEAQAVGTNRTQYWWWNKPMHILFHSKPPLMVKFWTIYLWLWVGTWCQ